MTVLPTTREDLTVKPTGRDQRGRVTEIPTSEPDVFLSVFTFLRKPGYGGQPRYVSQVMGVRHMPRDGSIFSSTLSAPMSAKTVEVSDFVTRFGAKALNAAHEAGVRRVLELIDARLTDDLNAVLAETPDR